MLQAACAVCPRRKARPSVYVAHLLTLRIKRLGGYPFRAEELDEQAWFDLGVLELYFQQLERQQRLF